MRNILLIILLVTAITHGTAQTGKKISAAQLVKITESADFPALVKLVKSLSYQVADSSRQTDGSLIYISRENKINGNILGCTITARHKMNHLSFTTYDKINYDELKKQLKALGFKSSGTGKGHFPEIVETEDFEKGKVSIGTGAKKRGEMTEYEFIFMKW